MSISSIESNPTSAPVVKPTVAARKSPPVLERVLSHPAALALICAFFVAALLVWASQDHCWPVHDAAWHSCFSNAVKQWLCRPKGWSLPTLTALLTMQPYYPAGVWFFNGTLKIFLGDTLWSEHVILAIHLLILNISSFTLVRLLTRDTLKATLTVLLLDCCPLVLALQHVSYIDLPHTAFFTTFYASLVWWWQNKTWKRTAVCGGFFALYCLSKQIAVLYSAPTLALLAAYLLFTRQYKSLLQVVSIGLCGVTALMSWALPNLNSILHYTHNRSALASHRLGFLPSVIRNLQIAGPQIFQAFSPMMAIMLCLSASKVKRSEVVEAAPIFFASIVGAVLMILAAFFNLPETRYFGPLMLPLCFLLATAAASLIRQSKRGSLVVCTGVVLCVAQALLLCFQKCPIISDPRATDTRPVYVALGVTDPQLSLKLSYVPSGDPWKQQWLFDYIEKIEHRRPVYLNVLNNTPEYNQGTLLCISKMRRSCVYPTTWRGCMPDVTDSFAYTDGALHYMQWVVVTTSKHDCPWYDKKSQENYEEVLAKLKNGGLFREASRQRLPDDSEVILYQNKFWMLERGV